MLRTLPRLPIPWRPWYVEENSIYSLQVCFGHEVRYFTSWYRILVICHPMSKSVQINILFYPVAALMSPKYLEIKYMLLKSKYFRGNANGYRVSRNIHQRTALQHPARLWWRYTLRRPGVRLKNQARGHPRAEKHSIRRSVNFAKNFYYLIKP